jgi:hypothetical protein
MWVSLSQELMDEERDSRLRTLDAHYRRQELLRLAGYVSPTARLRSRAAGALLRLAMALDGRIVEASPRTLRHA